ncbi:hypothetical protein [Streptomyces sp. NPDC059262]|uniref:hypothetical protein n=1 Tax=Streptomyces sp. NPDC059262 TaxID=3346797 RepID=UPI0036AE9BD7
MRQHTNVMMPVMTQGGGGEPTGGIPRSRLQDYAELVESPTNSASATPATNAAGIRREFAVLLGEFRRTAVLLPLSDDGFPLTGDFGGVRWLYAFSKEIGMVGSAGAGRGFEGIEWRGRVWPGGAAVGGRPRSGRIAARVHVT